MLKDTVLKEKTFEVAFPHLVPELLELGTSVSILKN